MANNTRFLSSEPVHTFKARRPAPKTTTTDQLLYRKLLDAVQLLQIEQTAAADLMVTHVIDLLEESNAAHTTLYPIARQLAAWIAAQQATTRIDVLQEGACTRR